MSSALAIASVTHVLKERINDGLINFDVATIVSSNVSVTALPPDRIDTENEASQLNLFMYLATANPGWRNHQLPSHNSRGERTSNPFLALDLHYLLTAYGAEELHHDILLGLGMQLMHETPVLHRQFIRRVLNPQGPGAEALSTELTALSTSELAEQIELIKISPETLNTEEISRLWTAFGAKYRPHAAYTATVVLIESRHPTKSTLPVRQRKLYVRPFHRPTIEKIRSQKAHDLPINENQKILPGYRLVLDGLQLKGETSKVVMGGTVVEAANMHLISDQQFIFSIPNTVKAGIQSVQIVHEIPMGDPPLPHQGVSSNVEAFVLSPTITAPIQVTPVSGAGVERRTVDLTFQVQPAIREDQRFVLLLNEIGVVPPAQAAAYSFEIPARTLSDPPGPTTNFTKRIAELKAGSYVVRIQVDGAESPLEASGANGYDLPSLEIA